MKHYDSLEAEIEATNEVLRALRSEIKAGQEQLARLVELVEKQQAQLAFHESSIARLDRILMEMLTGRTWRTLRATGELLKRIAGSRPGRYAGVLTRKRCYLVCDEPTLKDWRPRSGTFAVRGWCLAEDGVDVVRIIIPGLPAIETVPSFGRPDVKRAHPDLDLTGRSGFTVDIDSLPLSNGRYPITISLISKGVVVQETKTAVNIDHEKGFATEYDRWIKEFEQADDKLIRLKLGTLAQKPLISVLMPVFNTQPSELKAAIESVLDQIYENWELCIADDASSSPHVREILEEAARRDSRIKLAFQTERGGISRTCNAAWQMAAGEYVCFLDHDDTLAPTALAYVGEAVDRNPDADVIYSDEDKVDEQGRRFEPFFKPDWSPDLLLSENYICHLLVLRQDLATKIGWLNPEYDGSQDYDLVLRATGQATSIEHIPKVLYHWRAGLSSTASTIDNKEYAVKAAKRALERHCERLGQQMKVEPGHAIGRWRMRYPIPPEGRVSIVIASGGKLDILRTNLEDLFSKTTYGNYEVVVIDNSRQNSIERLVVDFQRSRSNLRYIDWRSKPFNYSAINNTAARQCDSPVLLFLNDDTSVITPDWLEAMVELLVRPEVGAVGAKLLYPDGRIQHAGVVMGLYDNCGHAFKGMDGGTSHYFDFSEVIRNVSAITGACLMVKADVFWQAGGFDENQFAVAFNDIDLCLKIGSLGYRVLYTPHAALYHHEAFSKTSRDLVPHPEEVNAMRAKWGKIIAADPYYSPNLTRNDEDYSLRTRG